VVVVVVVAAAASAAGVVLLLLLLLVVVVVVVVDRPPGPHHQVKPPSTHLVVHPAVVVGMMKVKQGRVVGHLMSLGVLAAVWISRNCWRCFQVLNVT